MLGYRKIVPKASALWLSRHFRNPCVVVIRTAFVREVDVNKCQTEEELITLKQNTVSFNDTRSAYRSKTTGELLRALLVFRLCSINFLVDNNIKLMNFAKTVLRERLFNWLMKATFYGHFVGGEDQVALKPVVSRLQKFGVGAILDYSVEEDLSEDGISTDNANNDAKDTLTHAGNKEIVKQFQQNEDFADRREKVISARTYFYEDEHKCDAHLETFLKCIDAVGYASENGFAAIKLTALGRPQLLLRLSEILYQTKYHFDQMASKCAEGRIMNRRIARKGFFEGLLKLGMHLTEEEADVIFNRIDINKSGDIDIIEWSHFLTPQLELSKLFQASPGAGDPVISALNDRELEQMENMRGRLHMLAARAMDQNVRLMVDAEQTYFQPAISRLTLDMQRLYNKEKPIILNTYQCYLKDAYNSVETDMELARRECFKFGAKIVRGAYMEQEKARAQAMNYEDPIHTSYQATCDNYNKIVSTILDEVKNSGANIVVASHNEDSVVFTLQRMSELSIPRDQGGVYFAQLLGMCDQVSFVLGQSGYNVFKYVPYGSVSDVLPYLSRRAAENRGLLGGVLTERKLLWSEVKRRAWDRELFHDPYKAVVSSVV